MKLKITHILFYGIIFFAYLFFCLVCCTQTKASHISGSEITWTWVSGNTYSFKQTLYRNCSGIPAPNSTTVIFNSASTGLADTLTLYPVSYKEVVDSCDNGVTTCNGGTQLGIEKIVYEGELTLPAKAFDWLISWNLCCRSSIITNVVNPSTDEIYNYALLNNLNGNYDSPTFNADPINFACTGIASYENNSVSGGDSVVYKLVNPLQNVAEPVVFSGSFSAANPVSSSVPLQFNNGTLSFTDPFQEVDILAVEVDNYVAGVLVSVNEIDEEIISEVCNCSTPLPVTLLSFTAENHVRGITNLSWSIASEINSWRYILVRNGVEIATVPSVHNSDSQTNYFYRDFNYQSGIMEYDLFEEDYDGIKTYLANAFVDNKGFTVNVMSVSDLEFVGVPARCHCDVIGREH